MLKKMIVAGTLVAAGMAMTAEANAHSRYGFHKHGYHGGYGYGYRHCFFVKRKFWGYYGPYYKRIRICR